MTKEQCMDCDHSGSSTRALLSSHRTSAGAVRYLRCSCGAWLVLLEDDLLAVAAPPPPPPPGFTRVRGDLVVSGATSEKP